MVVMLFQNTWELAEAHAHHRAAATFAVVALGCVLLRAWIRRSQRGLSLSLLCVVALRAGAMLFGLYILAANLNSNVCGATGTCLD